MVQFACKVCERGSVEQRKIFRMSMPVVVIGFILLIPSVLGMLFCAFAVLVGLSNSGSNGGAAAIAISVFVGIGIAFFVGGLIGWLLVMKKRVLQCSNCGATISAS